MLPPKLVDKDGKSALVQVVAWHHTGDKPLPEAMGLPALAQVMAWHHTGDKPLPEAMFFFF